VNSEIISAFTVGLIAGAIPGPVLTMVFTEILQSNFVKSFRVIFWAMFMEAVVALMSLFILSSLNLPEAVFRILTFVGAGVLVWIAFSIWKVQSLDTEEKIDFSIGKIAAMILANGLVWTFWLTIVIPKAIVMSNQIMFGNYIYLALVETGLIVSTTIIAYIFSHFRKILSKPNVVPITFKVFALTFIYFALKMTYQSVMFFSAFVN